MSTFSKMVSTKTSGSRSPQSQLHRRRRSASASSSSSQNEADHASRKRRKLLDKTMLGKKLSVTRLLEKAKKSKPVRKINRKLNLLVAFSVLSLIISICFFLVGWQMMDTVSRQNSQLLRQQKMQFIHLRKQMEHAISAFSSDKLKTEKIYSDKIINETKPSTLSSSATPVSCTMRKPEKLTASPSNMPPYWTDSKSATDKLSEIDRKLQYFKHEFLANQRSVNNTILSLTNQRNQSLKQQQAANDQSSRIVGKLENLAHHLHVANAKIESLSLAVQKSQKEADKKGKQTSEALQKLENLLLREEDDV